MNNYFKVGIAVMVAILLSAFVPYTQTYETKINASLLEVVNQINYANNWKNWYLPYKNAFEKDSTKHRITQDYKQRKFSINDNGNLMEVSFLGPTLLEITFANDTKTSILLKALLAKNDNSKLVQILKTSFLNYCWLYITHKIPNYNFGKNLKYYFDTPLLFYGFKIIRTGVVDTNFYILSKNTLKQKAFATALLSHEKLIAYTKKNNLKVLDIPFLTITPTSPVSVKVTSMLTAMVEKIDYKSEISYLKMPKNGNMLIGYFKGEYRKRGQLYNSMDKYIIKNSLTRVVSTFEKFLDKKLPKNDSSVVDMALYYPIY